MSISRGQLKNKQEIVFQYFKSKYALNFKRYPMIMQLSMYCTPRTRLSIHHKRIKLE